MGGILSSNFCPYGTSPEGRQILNIRIPTVIVLELRT